ncbi:MAG: DUF1465 family protein [Qipengyuania sp.]
MTTSRTLTSTVVEDLYERALVLADEARAVFDLRASESIEGSDDLMRIALSIEGLKTTTRVMHTLAWLLNQRAYLSGEISERQLDRCGDLPPDRPSDPTQMELLQPETRALIRDTEDLHARVARLNAEQRSADEITDPVNAMQRRIANAFGRKG